MSIIKVTGSLALSAKPVHCHAEPPFLTLEWIDQKGEIVMKKNQNIRKTVITAVLSSIAYLLMMLDFPFPGFPSFLKIDFSEIPALLAAIIFGPGTGIVVEALKNTIHYGVNGSPAGFPIDQVANFLAGTLFILPTSYLFRKWRTKKGLTLGLVAGTLLMTSLMAVFNYFVLLPFYMKMLNWDMTAEYVKTLVLTGIIPFNVLKGVFVGLLFALVFSRIQPWLLKQQRYQN